MKHTENRNRKTTRQNGRFIVRIRGAYALRFDRRFYEVVGDREATRFETAGDAELEAQNRGIRGFEVDEI